MGALAEIKDIMRTPQGQAKFIEWFADDFTQRMLAAAKELARPFSPQVVDPVQVAMTLGESVGGFRIVDFFTNPQTVLPPTVRPVADYGARSIAQQETR